VNSINAPRKGVLLLACSVLLIGVSLVLLFFGFKLRVQSFGLGLSWVLLACLPLGVAIIAAFLGVLELAAWRYGCTRQLTCRLRVAANDAAFGGNVS
jgi:hypothetical protein